MRIFYDGYIYAAQRTGGISRYFSNLIARLPAEFEPVVTGVLRRGDARLRHPRLQQYRGLACRPKRIFLWLQRPYFHWAGVRQKPDVAHPTYHFRLSGSGLNVNDCPAVFTVHDLIPELFPDLISSTREEIAARRTAIETAQAIICVSENTRADLLEFYPQAERKIFVIYHAAEFPVDDMHTGAWRESPYFLYVGARYAYKGFDAILQAFAKLRQMAPDVRLRLAGPPLNRDEARRIAGLKLGAHIEHAGYANDRDLARLYRGSVALVYPSRYEGFGLPLVEAMVCGTPIIASNSSSIPEVMGGCGLLCEPGSVDEIAEAMLALLRDSSLRHRCIEAGLRRARNFSWERTVSKTIDVYRSVM